MSDERASFTNAIAKDDVVAVRKLLGVHPTLLTTATDDAGRSPLHTAARHDARGVAEALVQAGADFYARDVNGQLPLDLPPDNAELNATRQYLRDVNRSRNDFLGAVHEQQNDRVKALLAADPSLATARDIGDGWTPMMTACHFGNEPLLAVLIAAGAKPDGADFTNGHDAVYVAAEKGHAGCLRQLIDAGADASRTWTVNYGRLPMRMNALHVASWKGHGEVVGLLLSAKLDPNARARSYAMFSPLHFAATEGHAGVVKQLLTVGADREARDGRRGITALQMAEAGKHADAIAVLQAR